MENVPKKIYLQIGDDCPNDVDFNELVGVSWCIDRINDNDIEFILVTREGQPVPDTEANDNKHAVILCPTCNGSDVELSYVHDGRMYCHNCEKSFRLG